MLVSMHEAFQLKCLDNLLLVVKPIRNQFRFYVGKFPKLNDIYRIKISKSLMLSLTGIKSSYSAWSIKGRCPQDECLPRSAVETSRQENSTGVSN